MGRRRFVRYSLLLGNVLLLGGIVYFVAQSSSHNVSTVPVPANSTAVRNAAADPLDQLSSADIAVGLAKMTRLPEATAVTNQADSVVAELAVPPAQAAVIAKPQSVSTELKSRKDIRNYVVQPGEDVAAIAAKFSVTSESVRWSNGLSGNIVAAGTQLVIPPVNGIVYTVAAGDTPDSLAQKYRASKEQIIAYNDAELSGLAPGERIIIPNGQLPAPAQSRATAYGAYSGGFAWGSAPVYGSNGYDYGFCTWYVANERIKMGRPLPANLGDAWTWDDRASAAGLSVSTVPTVGAAVVTSSYSRPGHVALVERVNEDGSVWISEMNSRGQRGIDDSTPTGGWGVRDYKLIPAGTARSYNYIH